MSFALTGLGSVTIVHRPVTKETAMLHDSPQRERERHSGRRETHQMTVVGIEVTHCHLYYCMLNHVGTVPKGTEKHQMPVLSPRPSSAGGRRPDLFPTP